MKDVHNPAVPDTARGTLLTENVRVLRRRANKRQFGDGVSGPRKLLLQSELVTRYAGHLAINSVQSSLSTQPPPEATISSPTSSWTRKTAQTSTPQDSRAVTQTEHRDNSAPIICSSGLTPLHFAAANGHSSVVRNLLLHGVTPGVLARTARQTS